MSHPTITVRATTRADLGAVDALLARSVYMQLKRDYAASVLGRVVPLITRTAPGLVASGSFFAVERGGQIAGCGGWSWAAPVGASSLGPRDVAHVRLLITDHRFGRCGVARALMARIVGTARLGGVGCLDCLSTLTAAPFYRACGFCDVGPIEVHLRPGVSYRALRLKRSL